MKKYGYILFLVSVVLSCKEQAVPESQETTGINIQWPSTNAKDVASIIDTILYIPIETHVDGLFGKITKLMSDDDKIYIFDRDKANALLVFDMTGKFLYKAGNRGGGPGEYSFLWNFTVDEQFIYLLANSQKKIIIFDKEGKFIKEMRIPFNAHDIGVSKNGNFMFTYHYGINDKRREGKHRVFITDSSFKIEKELFKINDTDSDLTMPFHFLASDNKIIFQNYVQDSLIIFNRDNFDYNVISIDFKEHTLPENLRQDPNIFFKSDYHFLMSPSAFLVGKYLVGTVFADKKPKPFILDIENNQLYLNLEETWRKRLHYPEAEIKGHIAVAISGSFYKTLMENQFPQAPKDTHDHLQTDDNVALILYKLKQ